VKSVVALSRVSLILVWLWLTLALAWPPLMRSQIEPPLIQAPGAEGVNYLIVAPEALEKSAQAWATYRRNRGYPVKVEMLSAKDATIENIRELIQTTYAKSGQPYPFFVLLLGHAHPDSSYPQSYLPAAQFPLDFPPALAYGYDHIPGDDVYALKNFQEDGFPIAIGRVPAHTDAEAEIVLARTQAYETQPPSGAGRSQMELFASDSLYGPMFDQLAEKLMILMAEKYAPDDYQWHMLYGHPGSPYTYPLQEFPAEVARRMNNGALMVTYIGHGSRDYLGPAFSPDGERGRVFDSQDLGLVTHADSSVMAFLACSVGEYDLSGDTTSLAEQLLLKPGGPVATYAASMPTLPAGNTLLIKDLFQSLMNDQAPTAGEWIRQAESAYRTPGTDQTLTAWTLRRSIPQLYRLVIDWEEEAPEIEPNSLYRWQQYAYNLFGDPALALAYPKVELDVHPRFFWQPPSGRLGFAGSGHLHAGETVTVSLNTMPGTIQPATEETNNPQAMYLRANKKTVANVSVTVDEDGEFSGAFQLPAGLPSGHYFLQALSMRDGATFVGSHSVYLGWPPFWEILESTAFWWLLVSLRLLRQLKGRFNRGER